MAESEPLEINDVDFVAKFQDGRWNVSWRWKGGPPNITNKRPNYGIQSALYQGFDEELHIWIKEEWLQLASWDYDDGILPLIHVEQPLKGNVRPVLDFREVNRHVVSHTPQAEVCDETIRRWRQMRGKMSAFSSHLFYPCTSPLFLPRLGLRIVFCQRVFARPT